MNDNKQELLDEIQQLEQEDNGLDFKTILLGLGILFTITILCAPKIYLASQIYYVSAQTNMALDNYKSLKEENIHLRKKLEVLKFNTEVMSSLPQ